jgi:hypothetical protein
MLDHKGIAYAVIQKPFTLQASGDTRVTFGTGDAWPQGLIRRVWARVWSSAISLGGGSGITGGGLNLIRAFSVSSQLHKPIYNNIDAKLWNRFMSAIEGRAPDATDPTVDGFSQMLPIFFALPDTLRRPGFRRADSALLNLNGQAKPRVDMVLGPITDIVDSGTGPTCSGFVDLVIEYEPNPQPGKYVPGNPAASGDEPGLQLDVIQSAISSLGSLPEAQLPVGAGRILCAFAFREEQPSTSPVTEQDDILTPGASQFTMKYGPDNIVDGVPVSTLDAIMQQKLATSLTAGFHLYLPCEDGKYADAINVRDARELRAKLTDIATPSDREVQLLGVYARDVEAGATWAAQLASSKNA